MRIPTMITAMLTVAYMPGIIIAQTSITPSQPTHYFYTPMAKVNPQNHLVVGFHEISFGLPANLQIQASLLDNIGRVSVGAKYGMNDDLSVGAGLAHSIVHTGRGAHGIPYWASPRLGAFLCWGFLNQPALEAALTPHTQIGDHVSIGCDIGLCADIHPVWSFIWEIGSSVDLNDNALYLNTDGGLRIHPPSIPFLNFDLGIDLEEFRVGDSPDMSATVYFDILFSMVVR
jgi:hypothetical protein